MGEVLAFSSLLPEPTGSEYLDQLEADMILLLANHRHSESVMTVVRGLSMARSLHPESPGDFDPDEYLIILKKCLTKLSDRDLAKLRHPSRSRAKMQELLVKRT